jgi:hypothetical protein
MQQRRATALSALFAAVFGIIAAVHYHRLGLTLAHYDARAHLVVSRRIFDSLYPGWQQVGAVWLPLPHVLNALPVQIDWLYRTGYSAVAIAVASTAVAAWAIASLIHRATGSTIGGLVAMALLVLNPNVLYLQSTPMTEPLLFATTFLAAAAVARWSDVRFPMSRGRTSTVAGWVLVAATLTRFEAWPIVGALLVLSLVVFLRGGLPVGDASRRVRGLAYWPMWAVIAFLIDSKITVGSWFVSSGFFIPDNPARGHPWAAWIEVWDGLERLSGPVVPWLACVAAIAIAATPLLRSTPATNGTLRARTSGHDGPPDATGTLFVLALAACAILPWAAYYQGHPVRIRYDVPLVAAAAALVGAAVALLPRAARAAVAGVVVAIAVWQAPPFDRNAPVVVEAQRVAAEDAGRTTVTAYLTAHWDGRPIMMSMGSLAQYMHDLSAAGFYVRDFLHEGNGELWTYAMRTPRPYVEWIAIQEKEDRDEIFRQSRIDPRFLDGYVRVSSGGGIALYRRCSGDCGSAFVDLQSRIGRRN